MNKVLVLCCSVILLLSFTGCQKETYPEEMKDFYIYHDGEVVAKIGEDFGIFKFRTVEPGEENDYVEPGEENGYRNLIYPLTLGYQLDEVSTYRGAQVGDTLEELAEKYGKMEMTYIYIEGTKKDDNETDEELAARIIEERIENTSLLDFLEMRSNYEEEEVQELTIIFSRYKKEDEFLSYSVYDSLADKDGYTLYILRIEIEDNQVTNMKISSS